MVENIHIMVSGVCVPSGVVDGNQSFERKYYLSLYSEKNFYCSPMAGLQVLPKHRYISYQSTG